MTKSKFQSKRNELANALGLLVLGWYDYAVRYERNGEKAPEKDYVKFKKAYDVLISRYAKLWNKTGGKFDEVSEYGNEEPAN